MYNLCPVYQNANILYMCKRPVLSMQRVTIPEVSKRIGDKHIPNRSGPNFLPRPDSKKNIFFFVSGVINLDSYKLNGEWEIYNTNVMRNEFFYDCCPDERFANVAFELYLRRRHTFYVLNVILPSIMTSVLLLSVFFCTPGQKVIDIHCIYMRTVHIVQLMYDISKDISISSLWMAISMKLLRCNIR